MVKIHLRILAVLCTSRSILTTVIFSNLLKIYLIRRLLFLCVPFEIEVGNLVNPDWILWR